MKSINKTLLEIACLTALCALPVYGADSSPTPAPSASPSSTPHLEPSPSASPSSSPRLEPSPSPSASPDEKNGDNHNGDHGDFSLHGLYEGTTSAGGIVVFYIEKNTHIQINQLDLTGQTIGFAEGQMTNGAFAFTLSNGQSIAGTADEHVISGTVGGATYRAQRASEFGGEHTVAGRFDGVAHNSTGGESRVMFIIDSSRRITMIQVSGTAPNLVRTGGFGTVTPPVAPSTSFTFTLDRTIGSSSPITGSFTVNDGVFSGTFTTSAGSFTVNSFKSTLSHHMANISTRGLVGQGQGELIGGFIITGGPKMVMIRAIGPSLSAFGVSPVLDNPKLQLFANQTPLASNDDWKTNANAADIIASRLAPTNDLEAALLVRLEPGAYSTVVTGSNTSATGIALVEIYEAGDDD